MRLAAPSSLAVLAIFVVATASRGAGLGVAAGTWKDSCTDLSISPDGTQVACSAVRAMTRGILIVTLAGKDVAFISGARQCVWAPTAAGLACIVAPPGSMYATKVVLRDPDGAEKTLAEFDLVSDLAWRGGKNEVWVAVGENDTAALKAISLTGTITAVADSAGATAPAWDATGDNLMFVRKTKTGSDYKQEITWRNSAGADSVLASTTSFMGVVASPQWSSDGDAVAYIGKQPAGGDGFFLWVAKPKQSPEFRSVATVSGDPFVWDPVSGRSLILTSTPAKALSRGKRPAMQLSFVDPVTSSTTMIVPARAGCDMWQPALTSSHAAYVESCDSAKGPNTFNVRSFTRKKK